MILLVIAGAWLSGATLGALGYGEWWPALALGGAGVAVYSTLTGGRAQALLVTLAVGAALVSLARYESALPPETHDGVAVYNDGAAVRLLGTIVSEPDERPTSQRFVVEVAAVAPGGEWQETAGRILVTARLFPRYEYGNLVDMTADLETPPVFESFDYRDYLARRGVVSTALYPSMTLLPGEGGEAWRRALVDVRTPLSEALEASLPEPEAALAQGILLGRRAAIPEDVNEAFNAAGISHLIAISGYNVMLVAGAATGLLAPLLGRRKATWVAMALVVAYAGFVGLSPSVQRAAVMAVVLLGARLAGRPGSALTAVAFAGAVLVAVEPLIIDDVSFQLSFAATVGIVVLATPLREWLLQTLAPRLSNGLASAIADQVAVTTAASLAVIPVIATSFGRLSLVAIPANVLAAPAFVFALAGGALTALAGAIDTGFGRAVGEVAYVPLHYLVVLAEVASALPLASVTLTGFGLQQSVVLIVSLLALAAALERRPQDTTSPAAQPRLGTAPVLAVASFALAAFVWWGVLQPENHHLRVSVLDVGQGDAILIEAPSGARVLIDGGPSGALITQALGDVLPPTERRIDLVVLTHAQDDHVTGLVEVLERYDVGGVLWNGIPGGTGAFAAWQTDVTQRSLPVTVAEAGQVIDLGGGAYLDVLHPQPQRLEGTEDDFNNNAIVLRLVYGEVSFLLTGDIEAEAEEAILNAGLDVSATVLKVAHHGSDGATTRPFLDAVSPSFAVVSAGAGNAFGHPSPTLRLRLAGVPLLRTDTNGTVTFETDGSRVWLDYERGSVEVVEPAFPP